MNAYLLRVFFFFLFSVFFAWMGCTPAVKKVVRRDLLDGKQTLAGGPQEISNVVMAQEATASGKENLDWENLDKNMRAPFKDIFFAYNMYDLKPEAMGVLGNVAKAMAAKKELKLTIEGHCDERGSEEYNLALGEKRAEAVRLYLFKSGVQESRMRLISYGEERPLVAGQTEDAFAQNRRVHFEVNK